MDLVLRNEAGLAVLFLFAVFALLAYIGLTMGRRPALRPIQAFAAIHAAVREAAESGRPLHLSVGSGGIGDASSLQTLSGLQMVRELSQPAATATARLVVTAASPLAVPLVQHWLRNSFDAAGTPEEYEPDAVRFVADNRVAFAAGAGGVVRQTAAMGSVLLGDLRDEYLLLAEPAAQRGELLAAGSGDVGAQPFVWATAGHALLGEEIFAAGAYLGKRRAHVASLMAQDAMRLTLVLVILAGVLALSVPWF